VAAWGEAKPSEAHKAIISQLLRDDAEMRDLARQFVVHGMYEVLDQLKRGDSATRATIAKSLASTLTKAITETGEDGGDDTLRADMHRMMEEMRGDIQAVNPPVAKKIVPKS
jgi:hypothetical protein